MQLVIVLGLILCVTGRSPPEAKYYDDEFFSDVNVFAWAVDIPKNSYWNGIRLPSWKKSDELSVGVTPYESVFYMKNITSADKAMIIYTVRQLKFTSLFNRWDFLHLKSVPFCDDTAVPTLVHELLGGVDGCPVPEGWHEDITPSFSISNPLNLDVNVTSPYLQIITNVWSNNTLQAERLFSGTFYVTKMEKDEFESDIVSRTSL